MIYYVAMAGALTCTALGQLALKFSQMTVRKRLFFWASVALFVTASFCSYVSLKQISVDTLYIATSLTMVVVVAASSLLFDERVSVRNAIALAGIVCGVLVYALA